VGNLPAAGTGPVRALFRVAVALYN
jgi:hypothetical protein